MKLCVECDFQIDEKTGTCQKCGRVAFKVDDLESEKYNVEPYLPGEDDVVGSGRVSPIKYEPVKDKLPLMAIISNVVIVLAIIGILLYHFFG